MRKVTIVLIIISYPYFILAQSNAEKEEVMAVIFELFEGYRQGDSARVSATFTSDAHMQRVASREGEIQASPLRSVQGWLDYIGSGLDKTHDEPIWDYSVHIDNGLASVWTKFAFYLDGKFSHCGVDNFLLVKNNDGWRIFHIVDTNQKEGCEIPDAIRQKSEY
jgi:hypothetical protein